MLELPGLPAASPITFMAALGLLRVLEQDCQLDVQLGWSEGHARLDGTLPDDLPTLLAAHVCGRHRSLEFNWADTTRKVAVTVYRAACEKAQASADQRALDFMAAWGSEAALDKDGFVRGTRLDLTSGQQKLIRDLRALAQTLQDEQLATTVFRQALFGGPYDLDQSSYGLDPATQRSHATEHQAPSKSRLAGKRGWVWLFAESLPLHPVLAVDERRALPAGFDNGYFWPIWSGLLALDEIAALRALPKASLHQIEGISEIWHSAYVQIGKYGALAFPQREPRSPPP